jgi:hypothetical protein
LSPQRTPPSIVGNTRRRARRSFSHPGVTTYLENGGKLETAQQSVEHNSATTTKLYDRRNQSVQQEEIERIRI